MSFVAEQDMRVWEALNQAIPSTPPASGTKTPNSSSKKKKSFKWGPRDSLNSRFKTGKPGSKRWQRQHNEFFVVDLSRSLSDDDEYLMDDDDFYFHSAAPTPLKQLFCDDVKMKSFQPFIHITEEEEIELMAALEEMKREQETGVFLGGSDSDDDSDDEDYDSDNDEGYRITPEQSFYQIHKPLRDLLEQFHHTETIAELDTHLMRLYITEELTSLEICLSDSYQRKLAHGAAKYYCMSSSSKDTSEGRIIVFQKTATSLNPLVSLKEFLAARTS